MEERRGSAPFPIRIFAIALIGVIVVVGLLLWNLLDFQRRSDALHERHRALAENIGRIRLIDEA
ncbi:MAG TPA: hypothetical protein VM638_06940, partial [Actinomycetota bacterium]|nr:hypothetical protein [Actinomycetota bacterium]